MGAVLNVALRPGRTLTLEELVTFLFSFDIAKFKLPERLEFFDTLPLSGFGKVSKRELAAVLREPKGAALPGLTSEERARKEGGALKRPEASEG